MLTEAQRVGAVLDAHPLSDEEVRARQARYGPNVLVPERRNAVTLWVFRFLLDPMVVLLVTAGVTYIVLGDRFDNALRHTPSGGSVRVELDANGNDAIMRVRDTGVGIPYRDLPHIFERFYVVDRSRTRESGGAGLGLAIVKGIVEAHAGTVSTESMLGSGTVFTIRLPIMRTAPRDA